MPQEHHIYLYSSLEESSDYVEIIELLRECEEEDQVHIHLNCIGGCVGAAHGIMNSIVTTKATTFGVAEGCVYSAATHIFFCCDFLIIKPYCRFMFHTSGFDGLNGKVGELSEYVEFTKRIDHETDKRLLYPYVTKKELGEMAFGREVWLTSEEMVGRINKVENSGKVKKRLLWHT